jgi:cytoskeleton protein RodZ
MSDQANFVSPEEPVIGAASASPTAGGLLKAARQAAGLHLAILSVSLKVPVRQLEALEANQFPNDQSLVFARALASSVCRHLRTDPAPILALMPMPDRPLQAGLGLRQAYPSTGQSGRMRQSLHALPPRMVGLALGMVALIAALIWWPNTFNWPAWPVGWSQAPSQQEATGSAVSLATEAVALDAPTVNAASPSNLPTPAPTAALPSEMPSAISVSPTVSATNSPSSVVASAASTSELLFSAQNTSWIEVRDGSQRVLWTGVLNAGDTQRLNATRALSVVVGRADAIRVSFKGQPLDLAPHTQVNVARFEVKP